MSNSRHDIRRLHGNGSRIKTVARLSLFCLYAMALSGPMSTTVAKDGSSGAPPTYKVVRPEDLKAGPPPINQPHLPLDPKAMFVLEGMKAAKAQWRSGICDIVFSNSPEHANSPDSAESSTLKGKLTFAEGHGVRLDWIYPKGHAFARFLRQPSDVAIDSNDRTGTYIRTKNQTITWFQGRSSVDVNTAEAPVPQWIINFDPKAVGFASWLEFQRAVPWEKLIDAFLKKPTFRVSEVANDVYVLTWQLGSENSEWIVTVDADRGFSPTGAEMRQRPTNTEPWRTVQEFRTTWEKNSSIWVPIRYESHNMQRADTPARAVSMDFSWSDVNGSISDDAFTLESVGAPDTVAVIDSTLGQPVVTKPAKQSFPTLGEPTSRVSATTLVVVVANVLVVLSAVLWIVVGRARVRRNK